MSAAMRGFPLLATVALGMLPARVVAVNWEVEPRISALLSYVDNVSLVETNEQSDTVYQVNPAINLTGEGPRLDVNLTYGATILHRNRTDDDETFQQGRGSIRWSTKQDVFSIAASAARGQRAASFGAALPTNLETISDNRTTTTSYNVSPQFQYRFDGSAELVLQGSYSRVEEDGENVVDERGENRGYTAVLSSGTNFRRLDWSLRHSYQEFNIDEPDRDDHSEQSILTLGYLLSPTLRWFGSVGTEEIVSQGVEVFEDDGYWDTGLQWNPTSRTRLQVSAGDRAFGDSQSLSFSRQGRNSVFEIAYVEEVSNETFQQAFNLNVPTGGGFNNITLIGTQNEIFVSKRADVSLSLTGRRNTITIGVFDEQRERLTTLREENFQGVDMGWSLELGRRTQLDTNLNYAEREASDSAEKAEFTRFDMGVRREVAQNVGAAAEYSYNHQKTNTGTKTSQNIIRLSVTARF